MIQERKDDTWGNPNIRKHLKKSTKGQASLMLLICIKSLIFTIMWTFFPPHGEGIIKKYYKIIILFYLFLWLHCEACGILVP